MAETGFNLPETDFSQLKWGRVFLQMKDQLRWFRISQWVRSRGAVKHLIWKAFRVTEGKVMDIPAFFAYVNVDSATNQASVALAANVRFDPRGVGQEVIDSFPIGDIGSFDDSFVKEILSSRYGMKEVDFTTVSVGRDSRIPVESIVRRTFLVSKADGIIVNVYLRKIYLGAQATYRVETIAVDTKTGLTDKSTPQRVKPPEPSIREGMADFDRTIRQFKSAGYEESRELPAGANESNWDFDLNLPKGIADGIKRVLDQQDPAASNELIENLLADLPSGDAIPVASASPFVKMSQNGSISQWYSGPLPDPAQLEGYLGTPSVEASQIRGMFGGVDEAISLVNQYNASLLSGIAFIFNFATAGAYGVYLSALDEKIKTERVKRMMRQEGYEIEEMPNGSFSASHPRKSQQEISNDMQKHYQDVASRGGTTFGINMNKVLESAKMDIRESQSMTQDDWYDLATMHLAATMVHEATHAMGAEGEGPAKSTETNFLQWVLPKVNEKRLQRFRAEGREEQFSPLSVNPMSRRASFEKSAQYGAQFITQTPNTNWGNVPWAGVIWDAGGGPIEAMLEKDRAQGDFHKHNSIEKQMELVREKRNPGKVKASDTYEDLLSKDRQPVDAYRHIETLMEGRRERPLILPVREAEGVCGNMKVAYLLDRDGQCFGWMNNLDLPMDDRMMPWPIAKEALMFDWDKVRELPRYNPEYDRMGMYWRWKEPRFEPELWERMLDERPVFMTSPARRFAASDGPDVKLHTGILAAILLSAYKAILTGQIRGTRFISPKALTEPIRKFYVSDDNLKVCVFDGPRGHDSVWVAKTSIPDEKVERAEAFLSGKNCDPASEALCDYICGLSSAKRHTIKRIMDAVCELSGKCGLPEIGVFGDFPLATYLDDPLFYVCEIEFAGSDADRCVKLGELVAKSLGIKRTDVGRDPFRLSWELSGIRCGFDGERTLEDGRKAVSDGIAGLANPSRYLTGLTAEMLSYSPVERKISDIFGIAEPDLKAGVIKTLIAPEAVLASRPSSGVRAVRLALRNGFKIDAPLLRAILAQMDKVIGLVSEDGVCIPMVGDVVSRDLDKIRNALTASAKGTEPIITEEHNADSTKTE